MSLVEKAKQYWGKELLAYTLLFALSIASIYIAVTREFSGLETLGLIVFAFLSILITLEFERFSLIIRQIGLEFELFGRGTEDSYSKVIDLAREESPRAAELLEQVQRTALSSDSFGALSHILELGISIDSRSPLEHALEATDLLIAAKEYVDEFEDTEMKVVRFEDNILYIKSEERGRFLKEGLRFEVVKISNQAAGEEIEEMSERIAVAEVVLAQKRTTEMKIIQWTAPTNRADIEEIRQNELLEKRITVDIITDEEIEETSQEDLKEAKMELQNTIYDQGGS